jgi:hypothetical protein
MAFILRLTLLLLASLSCAWGVSLRGRPDVTCDLSDTASGLIIVSASAPIAASSTDPTGIWFHFNRIDKNTFTNEKILIAHQQFLKDVPSDFGGTFARLYALKLKAGEYEFRTWSFTLAQPGERSAVHSPSKTPMVLPFKVVAGRATYLGSFSSTMASERDLAVTVEDQSKRDMPVFAQKCPNVDAGVLDTQLLKIGPWN